MHRFRVSNLTKKELERAIDLANLTPLQLRIIMELNREERDDIGIMYLLKISKSKYYAEKRIALRKLITATLEDGM